MSLQDVHIKSPARGTFAKDFKSGDLVVWRPETGTSGLSRVCVVLNIVPRPGGFYKAVIVVLDDAGRLRLIPVNLDEYLPKNELYLIFIQHAKSC